MNVVDDIVWGPKTTGSYPRKSPIDLVVWHWTGGRTSEACITTLKSRELSIHYTIDHDGTVRRHADPRTTCTQHVGQVSKLSINARSIGIEIAHKGFAPSFDGIYAREPYWSVLRKKKVHMLKFADAQLQAARGLAHALSLEYGMPLVTPREDDGTLATRTLIIDEMKAFKGHAGHFHFADNKSDPGAELLEFIVGVS